MGVFLPPLRRARARGICFVLFVLLAGMSIPALADTGQDFATRAGASLLGHRAPALKLTTIDGRQIDLAALRGHKAVYLKFWATWCRPCREQMPHFEKVARTAGADLEVVAINIGFDDTLAQIRAYRREMRITMPIVRDDDGRIGEAFGLRVTPQHVVIGRDGRIGYVGHLVDAQLERALADARVAAPVPAPSALPSAQPARGTRTSHLGDAVPAATVRTLEGHVIGLRDPLARRRTVLTFLSPWCESYFARTRPQSSAQCRALRELLVQHGRDRSVRWIGVAQGLWASEQDVRAYRNEHRIPVPITLDGDGTWFRHFGIHRVPVLIVIAADGRIERRIDRIDEGTAALLVDAVAPPSAHAVAASDDGVPRGRARGAR
jgi:peroxiredoxin